MRSIRSKIPADEGSSIGRTYAMNVGFLHQIGNRFRVGAVLQNIGNRLSFNSPDIPDDLRRRFLVGAMYVVKDSGNSVLSLSMDANPPFDDGARYNFGAELVYAKFVAFRIGYMRSTNTYYDPLIGLDDTSAIYEERVWVRKGPTAGVGIKLKGVDLNLAAAPRREPILNSDERLRLEEHDPIISLSCNAKILEDTKKMKTFDCVEMKRRIQEGIYEETKNMTHEELMEYFHKRIANSRFSSFLQQKESLQRVKQNL